MSPPLDTAADLIAVDIGNSRIKLGRFSLARNSSLPEPTETLSVSTQEDWPLQVRDWVGPSPKRTVVGSVSRPIAKQLEAALRSSPDEWHQLTLPDLPIETRVEHPGQVGIDRLLAAVGANILRQPDRPAILIDLGTAITVDLVAPDGVFEGGAILPGPGLAAWALAEATDALPYVRLEELDASPEAIGRSTEGALAAGLFWGAIGAIRELIDRQRDGLTTTPQVFLTGGAAPSVARLIGGPDYTVRHLPHLTLAGIVVADLMFSRRDAESQRNEE